MVGSVAAIAEALAHCFEVMIIVGVVAIRFGPFMGARSYYTIGGQICIFQKFNCKARERGILVNIFAFVWEWRLTF